MGFRWLWLWLWCVALPALAGAQPTIRTLEELACYLVDDAHANPLRRLSEPTRLALLRSALERKANGATAVAPRIDGIRRELSARDARAALALFGYGDVSKTYRQADCATQAATALMEAARRPIAEDVAVPTDCGGRNLLLDASGDVSAQAQCWKRMAGSGGLAQVRLDTLMDARLLLSNKAHDLASRPAADALALVSAELDRRPHAGENAARTLYGALLATGQPDQADALVRAGRMPGAGPLMRRFPLKSAPPETARSWRTTPGRPVLTERAVDLTRGIHLVVYVAPACEFCKRAAREIGADPDLRTLFKTHGHWVHLPESNHSLAYYDEWMRPYGQFPIELLFDRRNWPEFDGLLPTIIVLKNGQTVARIKGWPENQLATLRERLQKVDVLR